MAWSVDRLGRSLKHLIDSLADLHSARIDLYLHQQAIDTSTDSGRAFFQMLGVFAEFERSLIQARVKAGVDRARSTGKRLGRPTIDQQKKGKAGKAVDPAAIRASLDAGVSIRKAAALHRVGISTVQRVKASAAA
jgi:DNA invertase Pin-like site-specific DNA recombinase